MEQNQPNLQQVNSPLDAPVQDKGEQTGDVAQQAPQDGSKLCDEVTVVTKDLLQRIGIEGEVYCRDRQQDDMPHVWIEIMTEESGLLIGERGVHLRALEHVLRLLLRDIVPRECRCLVDVNTYRLRRIEFLKRLARDASRRCSNTRHAVTLEPMPASERRVVHLALSGIQDIETESIGVEPQRRIVIRPCDPLAS